MIRVRILFAICILLGFLTLVGMWQYGMAGALNVFLELCTTIAAGVGRFLAERCGVNPNLGEALLIGKMQGGRGLAIALIAVLWYLLLGSIWNFCRVHIFKRLRHDGYGILGVVICIVVVTTALNVLWLTMPGTMQGIYSWHEQGLNGLFRTQGWDQAQTIMIGIFALQNIIVYAEAVLVYVLFTQIVRLVLWLIKKFFTGLSWLWNLGFGRG